MKLYYIHAMCTGRTFGRGRDFWFLAHSEWKAKDLFKSKYGPTWKINICRIEQDFPGEVMI